MEIILVRHTSVAVAKGTCYGWTDVALSDTFEQEATLTRTALLAHAPFDAAYSRHTPRFLLWLRKRHHRPTITRNAHGRLGDATFR